MLPTSNQYKDAVYSKQYARHFVPYILLKVIDTMARESVTYAATNASTYGDINQLNNDVFVGSFDYGVLEDFQYLLNGTKKIMPSGAYRAGQYGLISVKISDATGVCDNQILTCTYSDLISTIGRVLYFDKNYDSVPSDIDLKYYRNTTVIKTVQIRGNTEYVVTSMVGVLAYNKLEIVFLKTDKPYRRIHLIQEVPGIFLTYEGDSVVSIGLQQTVDIFSKEIVSGEIDFTVKNEDKKLDIFNENGIEAYLGKRQPVTIDINMVFPDGSTETVPLGVMLLLEWSTNKGALTASFTARDFIDSLSLNEYVKGVFPATPVSMYELAEAVLIDAEISKYSIDTSLMNVYTTLPLPIATHKELLRQIAQASRCVVLPMLEGGIKIKSVGGTVVATNECTNSSFTNDFTGWTNTGCTIVNVAYDGLKSAASSTNSKLSQTVTCAASDLLYVRLYVYRVDNATGALSIGVSGGGTTMMSLADLPSNEWTLISHSFFFEAATTAELNITCTNPGFYIDSVMFLNLTKLYGLNEEPEDWWCDSNIRYFDGTSTVPSVKAFAPVDTFDYDVLLDPPDIKTMQSVKSAETSVYSYTFDTATTEVYNGIRLIAGTDTFSVRYTKPAKDCTVVVKSLDDAGNPTSTNTAVVVSSTFYANAAVLTVKGGSNVRIIVSGKAANMQTSTYKIDADIPKSILPYARTEVIDNKLVSNLTVAKDMLDFALTWYNYHYEYNISWRQNPAIELMDCVTVFDDFNKNNAVMLLGRNIEYVGGVLGGDSQGVF